MNKVGFLIEKLVSNKIQNQIFIDEYNKLEDNHEISDNEYVQEIFNFEPKDKNKGLKKLTCNFLFQNIIKVSFNKQNNLDRFWKNISKISTKQKIRLMNSIEREIVVSKIDDKIMTSLLNEKFLNFFFNEMNELEVNGDTEDRMELFIQNILLLGCFLKNNYKFIVVNNFFYKIVMKILILLNKFNLSNLKQFFFIKIDVILDFKMLKKKFKISELFFKESNDTKSLLENENFSLKLFSKNINFDNETELLYNSLKITSFNKEKTEFYFDLCFFFWIDVLIKTWRFNNHKNFLEKMISIFIPLNFINDFNVISYEIVRLFFKSFIYFSIFNNYSYLSCIWKNVITTVLPVILCILRDLSDDNIDFKKSIQMALNVVFKNYLSNIIKFLDSKFETDVENIKKKFLLVCVFHKLLSTDFYLNECLSSNIENNQNLLNEVQMFNQKIDFTNLIYEKLSKINKRSDFFENSNLTNFFDTLLNMVIYLYEKQVELSLVIHKILSNFLQEKNFNKLSVFLFALLGNEKLLIIVLFNLNPYIFLNTLIDFLDEFDSNYENNDQYFKDSSLSFTIVFISVFLIIEVLNLDFSSIYIKHSFIIDYYTNFYRSLCNNFTHEINENESEEKLLSIKNYEDVFDKWIVSIFDETKSVLTENFVEFSNLKKLYKIVPLIFKEAIISAKSNIIDFQTVVNGLNCFSFFFFLPSILAIINWLLTKIEENFTDLDSLELNFLSHLIKLFPKKNDLNTNAFIDSCDYSNSIFGLILKVCGQKIISTLKKLQNYDSSDLVMTILAFLEKKYFEKYIKQKKKIINLNHNIADGIQDFFLNPIFNNLIESNLDKNLFLNFYYRLFSYNRNILPIMLIEKIVLYQNKNNVKIKVFINIVCYFIVVNSISSIDDVFYWLKIYSDFQDTTKKKSYTDHNTLNPVETQNHITTILDNDLKNDLDSSKKKITDSKNDSENDNLLYIDDDDLFNDDSTKESLLTSLLLNKLRYNLNKCNSLLCYLNSLLHNLSNDTSKTVIVQLIKNKIIENLKLLCF